MKQKLFFVGCFLCFGSLAIAADSPKKKAGKKYPFELKTDAEQNVQSNELRALYKKIKGIKSYTLIMQKRQRVKGRLLPVERLFVKFSQPFKVYMKLLTGTHKGREVMFVRGWNKNQLKVRERGGASGFFTALLKPLNLDPKGSMAMKGNRYPITEFGFIKTMENFIKNIALQKKRGDKARAIIEGYRKIRGVYSKCILFIIPQSAKNAGYFAHKTRLCYNLKQAKITEVKVWNFKEQLREHYIYYKIKMRAGLTAKDFDIKNKEYKF